MSNFTFIYPAWLLALFALPVIIILARRNHKQGLLAPHIAQYLDPAKVTNSRSKLSLFSVWWTITIIALAGPSFSTSERPSFEKTQARVLIMDMSMSMYATDVKPNRLTQARYKALDLLSQWREGVTGMVAYAGDAYTVSPLTTDSATISNLVPNLSPDIMPYQGADAAKAVKRSIEMLQRANVSQGDLILIADDIDDNEKGAINDLLSGTPWRLSVLAVGSRAGSPITMSNGSMLTQDSGQTVIAKSDIDNMRSISQSNQGVFALVQADNSDIETITRFIESHSLTAEVEKTTQGVTSRVNHGFWLLPLILFPALGLFRPGVIWSFLGFALLAAQPNPAFASPWFTDDQIAHQYYEQGDFEQAAKLFTDPEWKGVAQYQAGQYQEAENTL